jgi:PKD repeat protein
MMWTRGLVVVFLILLSVSFPSSRGVEIQPNVVFITTGTLAEFQFQDTTTFSRVEVGNTAVTFDSVTFSATASPANRTTITIQKWAPSTISGTAILFVADAPDVTGNHPVWFNLTGLLANRQYRVYRDSQLLSEPESTSSGAISFRNDIWSPHSFQIVIAGTGGGGGGGRVYVVSALFSYEVSILTVKFYDKSITELGEIVEWFWSFGDGETSEEQNPTHSYATGGDYWVTLTITDSQGRVATTTQLVKLVPVHWYIVFVILLVMAVWAAMPNREVLP